MNMSELKSMVQRNHERITAIETRLHRKSPPTTDNTAISRLAKHFGFDYEEAMRVLKTEESVGTPAAKPVVKKKKAAPKKKKAAVKSPKAAAKPKAAAESKAVVATSPKPASPKPAAKPKAAAESKVVVAESKVVVAESKVVVAESKVVVAESKVVVAESKVVVAESKAAAKPKAAAKNTVPLPWCGSAHAATVCRGLRLNHGLYTQCTMTRVGGESLCKTCGKQAQANDSGKPNYGLVDDRIAADAAQQPFKDPRGKSPALYSSVMEKMNITREQAEAAAAALDWTIPEAEFEAKAKGKRGRPSKKSLASVAAVADSDGETPAPQPAKNAKKGRKSKKVVNTADVKDDVILGLIAAAEQAEQSADETPESPGTVAAKKGVEKRKVKAAEKKAVVEAEAELEEELSVPDEFGGTAPDKPLVDFGTDSEEDELPVSEFDIEGKTYLKAADDILYDQETQEPVGVWNNETRAIDAFADDDDEM